MKSIRCPHCGLLNWATETACKRCRLSLHGTAPTTAATADNQPHENAPQDYYSNQPHEGQPDEGQTYESQPDENQSYENQAYENQYGSYGEQANGWQDNSAGYAGGQQYYAYQGYAAEAPKKTGLAIASMVTGIVSIAACGLLGLGTVTGLILGIVALVKAKRVPQEYGGQGFAIAGIVLSALSFFYIGIILAIAIPNIMAARRAANEAAVIRSINMLSSAEAVYQATRGEGQYGTMQELVAAGHIDSSLARGVKYDYRFEIKTDGKSFEITATPTKSSDTGSRSFYLSSEEQFVRGAKKGGMAATAFDPPLDQYEPSNPYEDERSYRRKTSRPPVYTPAYR